MLTTTLWQFAMAQSAMVYFLVYPVLSWVLWRFWRFTIRPMLQPNSPKELPYWIPFVGHGFAFFRGADSLLAQASNHFKTKEPFSLTVFGNTLYIVTEPQDTSEVYKNNDTLSFEMFVQDLFKSNGYSRKALKSTYTNLPRTKLGFPNPRGVSFGSFVREMHMNQLYPGSNLDHLDGNVCNWFNKNLSLAELQRSCYLYGKLYEDGSVEAPLGRLCSDLSIRAGEHAYFGRVLSEVDPDLANDFLVFDDLGWQVLYQYPSFLSSKMSQVRSSVKETFIMYLKVPQAQRTAGGASWLINAMEDEARALGISDEDIAVLLFNIYWVISTNTRKIAFWFLAQLLQKPALLDAIRTESENAFEHGELVNPSHLWTNCPQLDDSWHETLRLCSNAASVRYVDQDTVVGNKLLRKGNRIMIPYRLLHFDPNVYGSDSMQFRPDRFAAGQGDALTRGPSWRPFGGGKTLCTGRHAAKHATLIFVASILRRYDLEMVGRQTMPEADLGRPVLGISSVKDGQDFSVRLSLRKEIV